MLKYVLYESSCFHVYHPQLVCMESCLVTLIWKMYLVYATKIVAFAEEYEEGRPVSLHLYAHGKPKQELQRLVALYSHQHLQIPPDMQWCFCCCCCKCYLVILHCLFILFQKERVSNEAPSTSFHIHWGIFIYFRMMCLGFKMQDYAVLLWCVG